MKPKFNYGDYIFHAAVASIEKTQPCPDCEGKRYVEIIYNGTLYTLDCPGCERGWSGSTGCVPYYAYEMTIHEGNIEGVEKDQHEGGTFEYHLRESPTTYRILKEADVFARKEEAQIRAEELKKEREYAEASRILQKHKPDRTWTWNIHYYKKQIAESQKNIEYYTQKLYAAKAEE